MGSSIRHAITEFLQNYRRPEWIRHRINYHINRRFHVSVYPGRDGIDIPSADWDTLIILDACRADLFESVANLDRFNTYKEVISKESSTDEWLNQNFADHNDIVYVAGMGQPSKHKPKSFVELIEPWRDDDYGSSKDPEIVTEAAIKAHKKYPNKRIIVHYLQPHTPFINNPELIYSSDSSSVYEDEPDTVWEALGQGLVKQQDVWQAYQENLERVLPEVYRLLGDITGRVVVSADHGNLFGERTFPVPVKVHGHPPGIRNKSLVTVPWAVSEGNRRTIHRGSTESTSEASSREIQEQLRSLGYVE